MSVRCTCCKLCEMSCFRVMNRCLQIRAVELNRVITLDLQGVQKDTDSGSTVLKGMKWMLRPQIRPQKPTIGGQFRSVRIKMQ